MLLLQCVMLMCTQVRIVALDSALFEVAGQHLKRSYYLNGPILLHFVYNAVKWASVNFTEIPDA
jgi:hypothetical protein